MVSGGVVLILPRETAVTAADVSELLDLHENGVYTAWELPTAAVQILDESDAPEEAWNALPMWLRTELAELLAEVDRDDLIFLNQGDPQRAVLRYRRVRDTLRVRGPLNK